MDLSLSQWSCGPGRFQKGTSNIGKFPCFPWFPMFGFFFFCFFLFPSLVPQGDGSPPIPSWFSHGFPCFFFFFFCLSGFSFALLLVWFPLLFHQLSPRWAIPGTSQLVDSARGGGAGPPRGPGAQRGEGGEGPAVAGARP